MTNICLLSYNYDLLSCYVHALFSCVSYCMYIVHVYAYLFDKFFSEYGSKICFLMIDKKQVFSDVSIIIDFVKYDRKSSPISINFRL